MIDKCNQQRCERPAAFRFTWPGQDEAGICAEHAPQMRGIAAVMGLHLQLVPLESNDTVRELERKRGELNHEGHEGNEEKNMGESASNVKILARINKDRREIYATFHIQAATDETIAMIVDLLEWLKEMQSATTDDSL